MNLQMQHVDEIKALLNKIEKDLTANAANARVIKASLLAMENMLCAKADATMEEIEAACKKALILNDINALESGFDTELGENGVILSGGQCQRLALARAFLRNTPVLILDEATSALDNITQEAIMSSIDSMKSEHTVIIVAHRLSTIQNADNIFMIADKEIKDSGTHAELFARCREYRELYQSEEKG